MEERNTTNDNLKLIIAIVGSVFMPGVGNLIYNQTKIGLTILILTILLSFVYFLP